MHFNFKHDFYEIYVNKFKIHYINKGWLVSKFVILYIAPSVVWKSNQIDVLYWKILFLMFENYRKYTFYYDEVYKNRFFVYLGTEFWFERIERLASCTCSIGFPTR